MRITYIGHASLLIEMDGVRLLTDPVFSHWVLHLRRKKMAIDPDWYENIDAVLISHLHHDHLDLPTLKRLGKNTRLIVPPGSAALFRKNRFNHIDELPIGASTPVRSLVVQATYARHNGGRIGFGSGIDCLGFMIANSSKVYFAGDTDIFPEMAGLSKDLDIALIPVWGWGPSIGSGHMGPYEAAQALELLKPRLAIPMHWGTYFPFGFNWLRPSFLIDPPKVFARFAEKLAPQVKVQLLQPGEVFETKEDLE